MITQILIDVLGAFLTDFLGLIPPAPVEFTQVVTWLGEAGAWVGSNSAKLSPLVPFGVLSTILTVWLALLGLYLSVLAVRVVLWVAAR